MEFEGEGSGGARRWGREEWEWRGPQHSTANAAGLLLVLGALVGVGETTGIRVLEFDAARGAREPAEGADYHGTHSAAAQGAGREKERRR